MKAYFFVWNPKKDAGSFADYDKVQSNARAGHPYFSSWICRSTKPRAGDVAILQRTGNKNNGVFAKGIVVTNPYKDDDGVGVVDLELDSFLPIGKEIPRKEIITEANYQNTKKWTPMASGDILLEQLTQAILSLWDERSPLDTSLPEEVEEQKGLPEGAVHQILVNAYERNAKARMLCIDHYGLDCCICGFNFKAVYGDAGSGLIHVHHLKPLNEIRKSYKVDPIEDLRPVCPNCHAMIHLKKPAYTINDIKTFLKKASR